MAEFNDRMKAQRAILQVVNEEAGGREELFGLSKHAIERWIRVNGIDAESCLVQLIRQSADKLFFLANKSQDTITAEYTLASTELSQLLKKMQSEVRNYSAV